MRWFIAILSIAALLVPGAPGARAAAQATAGCLRCHRGIEPISDVPQMKVLSCTFCHRGDPDGTTKEAAHKGLWANPSDFRVASQTCGVCHREILERAKKSIHATSAGIISAARYTWGAQARKGAIYATFAVEDRDGDVPARLGALEGLKKLPTFDPDRPLSPTNNPVDDYLRSECLRCHLWSQGARRAGDYRASGCAACHVLYSDSGTYQGGDKAIGKGAVGRPRFHRITSRIPAGQCVHCHNRGGRIGTSFVGIMESDGYGAPWSSEPGKKGARKLHGKYYNHLLPDIHYQKGMECMDCHTDNDIHGDGNIYSKKDQAVEIECTDCHGTLTAPAPLKTARGTRLTWLHRRGGKVVLVSRFDGRKHLVPQVRQVVASNPRAAEAMTIPGHMKRMECYACHARWAPQCYGCHVQVDRTAHSHDLVAEVKTADPSKGGVIALLPQTTLKWRETRSYLRWEVPALGINGEGKVAPFIPGCQVVFTEAWPGGLHNHVFTTADGFSGIASNPVQPHTVRPKARRCEECHTNPKAVGLGQGLFPSKPNGIPVDFGLDQLVDAQGRQLQATSHDGARPFNRKELQRIRRVGVCGACHGFMKDAAFWRKVGSRWGRARTPQDHRALLRKIMQDSGR